MRSKPDLGPFDLAFRRQHGSANPRFTSPVGILADLLRTIKERIAFAGGATLPFFRR